MSGESPRQLDFRVAGALVGQRLDKALCGLLPDLSRAAVQRAITAGACRIDGLPVSTASLKLKAGQEVRLDLPDTANELRAEDEAVDILWQDEHLLLCNKPAGLTVHPCPSCPENTLVQRLLHHFPRLREQEGLRPGVVHRLDKDTSGLLLVALDEPTRLRMSEAFARREVHKEYLALVQGVPPQTGTCREPLGRHPTAKVKMAVVPENRDGKAAHSDWRVLWSSPRKDFSLVAVRIHTGRTHQIRVHMAHVGHPLLGDALYAPAPVAARAPRQMLHAWHISFCHPLSGEALAFFCPPPDDMLRTILNNSSRMQRLVITGNPGCGKSTLTHALEKAGLPTVSADALVEFETVVYPVPQYDPEHISMISQGPSMCLFNKEDPQEVLASWLFMQYLLTDGIQIAYSSTEGYVPVTGDARESADYLDYLSRAGEDNNAHYDVKIKASQLLLDHLEDTFVTPVFNGSASVRLAAGQLIEDTAKAVRRKQDTSDNGLEKIYENVSALYRLDAIAVTPGTSELGPLPTEAKVLLWALGLSWAGLAAVFLRQRKRKP